MISCRDCHFWSTNILGHVYLKGRIPGTCCRYPEPRTTQESYWCGEHKPKEAENDSDVGAHNDQR